MLEMNRLSPWFECSTYQRLLSVCHFCDISTVFSFSLSLPVHFLHYICFILIHFVRIAFVTVISSQIIMAVVCVFPHIFCNKRNSKIVVDIFSIRTVQLLPRKNVIFAILQSSIELDLFLCQRSCRCCCYHRNSLSLIVLDFVSGRTIHCHWLQQLECNWFQWLNEQPYRFF